MSGNELGIVINCGILIELGITWNWGMVIKLGITRNGGLVGKPAGGNPDTTGCGAGGGGIRRGGAAVPSEVPSVISANDTPMLQRAGRRRKLTMAIPSSRGHADGTATPQ
jgi:hypothetical protein